MLKFVSDNLMIIYLYYGFYSFPYLDIRIATTITILDGVHKRAFGSLRYRYYYDDNGRSDDKTPYGPFDQLGYLF